MAKDRTIRFNLHDFEIFINVTTNFKVHLDSCYGYLRALNKFNVMKFSAVYMGSSK